MSNIIGDIYKVITFGESHGIAIGCIIDGCPSLLSIDLNKIQYYLDQRKPGTTRYVTQRKEPDKLEILSGMFNGLTTGTPITFITQNIDHHSKDYNNLINLFRPGHADITYQFKYGLRDHRGGGRTSARVTIAIVIAGSLARQIINDFFNIKVFAYISSIGTISIPFNDINTINCNNYFIPNKKIINSIEKYIKLISLSGDSIGATVILNIVNMFCGIGSPIFGKLNSELTRSLMSINAVKSIEIGLGKLSSSTKGSLNNDQIYDNGFTSNHCGGILGGISTSQDIKIKLFIKPTSSIRKTQTTLNSNLKTNLITVLGRHDPCVGIRSIPIIESISCIVILDLILKHKALKFI